MATHFLKMSSNKKIPDCSIAYSKEKLVQKFECESLSELVDNTSSSFASVKEEHNPAKSLLLPLNFQSSYDHHLSHQELFVPKYKNTSLQFRGNFQVEETQNGISIQIKQPHFIYVKADNTRENYANDLSITNMNATNVNKTSIKIYPLKLGRTTIGSSSNNDIQVHGQGIEHRHCFIENTKIDDKMVEEFESCFLVTIYPLAKLCAIDGVIVDKPFVLNTG